MGLLGPFVGRLYDKIGPSPLIVPAMFVVSAVLWAITLLGVGTWWPYILIGTSGHQRRLCVSVRAVVYGQLELGAAAALFARLGAARLGAAGRGCGGRGTVRCGHVGAVVGAQSAEARSNSTRCAGDGYSRRLHRWRVDRDACAGCLVLRAQTTGAGRWLGRALGLPAAVFRKGAGRSAGAFSLALSADGN